MLEFGSTVHALFDAVVHERGEHDKVDRSCVVKVDPRPMRFVPMSEYNKAKEKDAAQSWMGWVGNIGKSHKFEAC